MDRLLAEGVWNAVVILREIQAAGYTGGDTILREYIAPKRALRAGRATVRFETAPGHQLQSDWGALPGQYSYPHPHSDPTGRWISFNAVRRGRSDVYVVSV